MVVPKAFALLVQTDNPSPPIAGEISSALQAASNELQLDGCDLDLSLDGTVQVAPVTWPTVFKTKPNNKGVKVQSHDTLATVDALDPPTRQAQIYATDSVLGQFGDATASDGAATCSGNWTTDSDGQSVIECAQPYSEAIALKATGDAGATGHLIVRGLMQLTTNTRASSKASRLTGQQCHAIAKWLAVHTGASEVIASNVARQDALLAQWRRRAFLCSPGTYPSKEWDYKGVSPDTGSNCNDGDMVLFSGMLCAVGEELGCDEVRLSQDRKSGQWWRSPNIYARGTDAPHEPNLNSDQALGVMLYTLQHSNGLQFREWMNWVATRGPCTAEGCRVTGISPPRYCSLTGEDGLQCVFRAVDCPLLMLTGGVVGEQFSTATACNITQWLNLPGIPAVQPDISSVLATYSGFYSEIPEQEDKVTKLFKKLGLDPPPFPPAPVPSPSTLDAAFKPLVEAEASARTNIEELVKLPDIGGLATSLAVAESVVTANAMVAGIDLQHGGKPGTDGGSASARHLAATALLILREFNDNLAIKAAAAKLLKAEPSNPYFEYLANGPTVRMIDLIVDQCPATDFDPDNRIALYQWSWERNDSRDAAQESMYWDCIFAMDLYRGHLHHVTLSQIGTNQFPKITDLKELLNDDIKQILDIKGQADSAEAAAKELAGDLETQFRDATNVAESVAKGAIPHYDHGQLTITSPPGTPGPSVTIDPRKGTVSVGKMCIFRC